MSQEGVDKTKVTKQVIGRAKTGIKSCYPGLCSFHQSTLNEGSWTRVLKVTKMRHPRGSQVLWSFGGKGIGEKQNDFHLSFSFSLNPLWFPIAHYTLSSPRVGMTSVYLPPGSILAGIRYSVNACRMNEYMFQKLRAHAQVFSKEILSTD